MLHGFVGFRGRNRGRNGGVLWEMVTKFGTLVLVPNLVLLDAREAKNGGTDFKARK